MSLPYGGNYLFFNLFLLVMMLILIVFASENTSSLFFSDSPFFAFCLAIIFYIFTVTLIYAQNMRLGQLARWNKSKMLLLAHGEIAIFFIAYYFILGIHRLFFFGNFFLADSFSTIFSLLLYLGGLAAFNYAQNRLQYGRQQAISKLQLQLSFLIPFLLPFLIFKILSDLTALLPWQYIRAVTGIAENSYGESLLFFLFSLLFIAIMTVIIPLAIIQCWKCKNLVDSPLKDTLTALCQKAKFKYAGLKTWDMMEDSMTAAIIGVWGRFRYVIFTPGLLHQLTPSAIEATLAHEIGHSKSKHLLIYPFIITGILLMAGFLASVIYPSIMMFFDDHMTLSSSSWSVLGSLVFFIIFASLLAILFRLIFGYFSRLFERQADLYIFELDLPAAYLIEAFDEIATASGHIHDAPNWHHYSIRERMDFLKQAENNPSLINIHRRKVMLSLLAYFIYLGVLIYLIFLNF